MKKILCIGDSLSLPGHWNKYEDTWIDKIKKKFPVYDFITFLKRALTTNILITNGGGESGIDKMPRGADCLEFYQPDIVVLQLGIVDCSPRLFKKGGIEKKLINIFPFKFMSSYYIKIIKKIRKRSTKRAYITPKDFSKNLYNYCERCKAIDVQNVIIIAIPYPDEQLISKNAGITSAIEEYNAIYDVIKDSYSFCKIVNPLDARKYSYSIYEDGYHPNQTGHRLVYKSLKRLFR